MLFIRRSGLKIKKEEAREMEKDLRDANRE
jgi:hypothetical protein